MEISNNKVVGKYHFGNNSISELEKILSRYENPVIFIDNYFITKPLNIKILPKVKIYYVETENEITTNYVDSFVYDIKNSYSSNPGIIVGIGGGSTLDMAKAVSNLLTNEGAAKDYQGWDLVKNPGIYKIGIPTLSGTGAESSRTCVMINPENGLKLGMNSEHTIYDQLILDPSLTCTVARDQYFYSGMDTFIHCFESLGGRHRHTVSDSYSQEAMRLCNEVFNSDNMMDDINREKLMVASYFGGLAIANSFVGVVHPFSAGLSVVLGIHHCEANCIVMRGMEEFYPEEYNRFWEYADKQNIEIRSDLCSGLSANEFERLYKSTIIHEKPLANALGGEFKNILTRDKVVEVFKKM